MARVKQIILFSSTARKSSFSAALAFVVLATSILGGAQTDVEDVHVTPNKPLAPADARNTTRSPEISYKATSDLVLVPVTITDSMNRPSRSRAA